MDEGRYQRLAFVYKGGQVLLKLPRDEETICKQKHLSYRRDQLQSDQTLPYQC